MQNRKLVPVSLPIGLAKELDLLVEEGEFTSKGEVLKFGARMVVLMLKRTHQRAEDYAYEEITDGLRRGKRADVS